MPRPRTGSVFYRRPHWRGVITTDEGRRFFYGKTEEEVRAKLAAVGFAPLQHRSTVDSRSHKAAVIGRILERADALGWDRDYAARVLAVTVTDSRVKAGITGPCVYCGDEFADTIDHVVALSRGGDDSEGNIVSSCRPCNSRKGSRPA